MVAGHPAHITLPSVEGVDHRHPALGPPGWHYTDHDIPQSRVSSPDGFWGTGALWTHDNTPYAVHVNRFRLRIDVEADDAGTQEVGREIAKELAGWWRAVAAWVEVLYEQDLSRLGPIAPGVHFDEPTLWTQLDCLPAAVTRVGLSLGRFNMVRYHVPDSKGFTRCIDHAQKIGFPADEWLFISAARSFLNGYDYRRAVLDAGLAAEVAVTRMITEKLTKQGRTQAQIDKTLSKNKMLGNLCNWWVTHNGMSALPSGYRARLLKPRNDATHAGKTLSRETAKEAIAVAADIVQQAVPLPR
ncbi:hypothetical protein [Mycolicibacterium mageritense]|uniref:hypothetical protein n=1 Tax=Mycolicibacterium mageritense TaxID=53462 RepID=UPI0011D639D2|nr:hypothetical protein [Mycolicibacterium mageritense]TXI56464.1 MAG: hypothetical protein E6Q55_28780 [Mycolicibacterium mageritense]